MRSRRTRSLDGQPSARRTPFRRRSALAAAAVAATSLFGWASFASADASGSASVVPKAARPTTAAGAPIAVPGDAAIEVHSGARAVEGTSADAFVAIASVVLAGGFTMFSVSRSAVPKVTRRQQRTILPERAVVPTTSRRPSSRNPGGLINVVKFSEAGDHAPTVSAAGTAHALGSLSLSERRPTRPAAEALGTPWVSGVETQRPVAARNAAGSARYNSTKPHPRHANACSLPTRPLVPRPLTASRNVGCVCSPPVSSLAAT